MKTKKILSIKVTDDKHVHDSKPSPELVNGVIKSDSMATTATGKLFADDGEYDDNAIFRYRGDNGILSCIKVRKNPRVRWKTGHILESYQLYRRKRICKSGKIVLDMEKDGL